MKTLVSAITAIFLIASSHAAVRISGTAACKISKPDCIFTVNGAIRNTNQPGTSSGSLRLVLWATQTPFPSRGEIIALCDLGTLSAGYQIENFRRKVRADTRKLNGNYHFTVALLEYTMAGWQTRDFEAIGRKALENGDFVTGTKWAQPTRKPAPPPTRLRKGNKLKLNLRANANLNGITPGTESTLVLGINTAIRLNRTFGSQSSKARYSWTTGKSTVNGMRYKVGKLTINPPSQPATRITLYFNGPHTGFYRQTTAGRITWGIFRFD